MDGVADFCSCVTFILLGACTCCSSTVGALFTVALVLGVVVDAGVRVDVDACYPDVALVVLLNCWLVAVVFNLNVVSPFQ